MFVDLLFVEQYCDNTDNRDHFGHYNRDKTFSYRYIPIRLYGSSELSKHLKMLVTDAKNAKKSNPIRIVMMDKSFRGSV